MSKLKLNAIATQALLDHEFEAAILNGHRRERLSTFGFTDEELNNLMAINASNLDQFIRQLGKMMSSSPVLS